MKIAYIILTWNSEKYIFDCLHSIFAVKDIESQVIVVDNGSKDKTLEILNGFLLKNSYQNFLQVISLDYNAGTTISRNIGLKKVDDDVNYVCILDSDTQINREAILKLTEYLNADSEIGIIAPKLISANGKIQPSDRNIPTATIKFLKAVPLKVIQKYGEKLEKPGHANKKHPYSVGYLMSAFWMFKPSLIKEIGLLDEKIFYAPEDVEYCIRVHKSGKKVLCCPEVSILHQWQRISKKRFVSKMNYEHIKGLLYLFYKHHFFFSAHKFFEE